MEPAVIGGGVVGGGLEAGRCGGATAVSWPGAACGSARVCGLQAHLHRSAWGRGNGGRGRGLWAAQRVPCSSGRQRLVTVWAGEGLGTCVQGVIAGRRLSVSPDRDGQAME